MKKIILLILTLCLSIFGFALSGCAGDNSSQYIEGGSVSTGGDYTGSESAELEFFSAVDMHVPISMTEQELTSQAYVVENGLKVMAELDMTGVSFGTAGEYSFNYVYGNLTKQATIYIYGLPTISGENTKSADYFGALSAITDGITASDCFGTGLDLQVLDDGGIFDRDGSVNVGQFTVKLVAIDRAGQSVDFDRVITVSQEREPELLESYGFDVNEQSFSFTLDKADADFFIGLSINGKIVPDTMLTINGTTYTVNSEFFYKYILNGSLVEDLENGDAYEMNVITNKGKATAEFLLEDKQPVVYDRAGLDQFVRETFACFNPVKIKRIDLLNPYQNVVPKYTMVKDGEQSIVQNGTFTFTKEGDWQLIVDLRGTKLAFDMNAYYDLGLNNGTIYSENNPFTNNLPSEYSLVGYTVYKQGSDDVKYLSCNSDAQNLTQFGQDILELNSKIVYDMQVVAIKDGKLFTQTSFFSIVKDGVGIMGDEQNSSGLTVANKDRTYLKYVNFEVGGRTGVYRWGANTTGCIGESTKLLFSTETKAAMKENTYLTFDIFYTQRGIMVLNLGDYVDEKGNKTSHNYYLWGRSSYYESLEADIAENGENASGLNPTATYCGSTVKFFDMAGNQIIRTSKDDTDPLMGYKNQWITVQVQIMPNTISASAGFYTYTDNAALDIQEVYISNMRISSKASMEDTTVIQALPDDSEATFEDIWW